MGYHWNTPWYWGKHRIAPVPVGSDSWGILPNGTEASTGFPQSQWEVIHEEYCQMVLRQAQDCPSPSGKWFMRNIAKWYWGKHRISPVLVGSDSWGILPNGTEASTGLPQSQWEVEYCQMILRQAQDCPSPSGKWFMRNIAKWYWGKHRIAPVPVGSDSWGILPNGTEASTGLPQSQWEVIHEEYCQMALRQAQDCPSPSGKWFMRNIAKWYWGKHRIAPVLVGSDSWGILPNGTEASTGLPQS